MSLNRLPSSPYFEMVVSHLRGQISTLQDVLGTIERTSSYDDKFVNESLKTVESELRRLRKLIDPQ